MFYISRFIFHVLYFIFNVNNLRILQLSDQLDQISNVAASAPMGGGSKAFQAAALAVHQTQQQQRAESEERYIKWSFLHLFI